MHIQISTPLQTRKPRSLVPTGHATRSGGYLAKIPGVWGLEQKWRRGKCLIIHIILHPKPDEIVEAEADDDVHEGNASIVELDSMNIILRTQLNNDI